MSGAARFGFLQKEFARPMFDTSRSMSDTCVFREDRACKLVAHLHRACARKASG